MAQLNRITGIPVATIKFYLREGLLHPGQRTGPNQASYDQSHVMRLRLVRTLREVGGLPIATIKRITDSLDDGQRPLLELVGAVADALGDIGTARLGEDEAQREASADVDAFLIARGLPARAESSARATLVHALVTLRRAAGVRVPAELFHPYERAMRPIAETEVSFAASLIDQLEHVQSDGTPGAATRAVVPESVLENIALGTVLFEPVILALRRIHHERVATEVFTGTVDANRSDRAQRS